MTIAAIAVPLCLATGCSDTQPPRPPDSTPKNTVPGKPDKAPKQEAEPPKDPIVAESLSWSAEEALANLPDPELSLSAAVRLVHLSELDALGVPEPLPIEAALKLACIRLSDWSYAIGVRDDDDPRLLHDPLLIDAAGKVSRPGHEDETDTETFALRVSSEPNIFPHVLIGERSIRGVRQDGQGIVLRSPLGLRFKIINENGYDHLSLVRPAGAALEFREEEKPATAEGDVAKPAADGDGEQGKDARQRKAGEQRDADPKPPGIDGEAKPPPADEESHQKPNGETPSAAPPADGESVPLSSPIDSDTEVEVARYKWDPFELMFMGPARDLLPGSQDQVFEMDLEKSTWLLPVGGIIGKPDPVRSKEDDEREPF